MVGGVRPRRRSSTALGLAILGLSATLAASCGSPAPQAVTEPEVRQALLAALQPVTLRNCTLVRFGSQNDGGYVMCKNLIEGIESAYSYGVGPNDDWGCDVSSRYDVTVHQYDCFDPARPACQDGRFVFHNECVGDRSETVESRVFDTLQNQIARNGETGKRLIVKMDIEGAEWKSLMATPDEVLDHIEQLPMELHGDNERLFLEVLDKLKRTFYLVNVHFNNMACSADAWPLPGWAYQVLFVNKRLGVLDTAAPTPVLLSPTNAPDNPGLPDCQLDEPDRAARLRQIREALREELRPSTLQNCTLDRFGSSNDGGYLMCKNLIEDLGVAYSYGVGHNDDWGCDISTQYGVPVHQYDCFDPARPVCKSGTFVFHNECIGDRPERVKSRLFDTLANQIAKNGDAGKRLIVKIDVEGAEWDSLMATPDEVLARIDQMPMELHGVNEPRFLEVVRKLKKTFYLVNVHFNNFVCSTEDAPLPGWAYQVLFVNKRIGVVDAAAPRNAPMSPLNAPDNAAARDCQLDPAT